MRELYVAQLCIVMDSLRRMIDMTRSIVPILGNYPILREGSYVKPVAALGMSILVGLLQPVPRFPDRKDQRWPGRVRFELAA